MSDKTIGYFEQHSTPEPMSGCWLWTGTVRREGYGKFTHNGRAVAAHRGAWEAANGLIPKGMYVCHRCDNPACVNPVHLFLGTHFNNMRDMVSKGRQPHMRGERNGRAQLTEHDVSIIKLLLELGVKKGRLVALYGVSAATVGHIKRGYSWSHVAPPVLASDRFEASRFSRVGGTRDGRREGRAGAVREVLPQVQR